MKTILEAREAAKANEQATSALREANAESRKFMSEQVMEGIRESVRDMTGGGEKGLDILDPKVEPIWDMTNPRWSPRRMREACVRFCKSIREANDSTMLGQLLRAGAQKVVNNMYKAVPVNYERVVRTVPSNLAIELYNPLARAGFPRRLNNPTDAPPRTRAEGLDVTIKNGDNALIFEVTKNLFDDDQSQQIKDQPAQAGQNMEILTDCWVWTRLIGAAGTGPSGEVIPASQTGAQAGESTWPYSTSFTRGGGANRPSSYAAVSYQGFLDADVLAMDQLDIKGQKMLVLLDTVFSGTAVKTIISHILASDKWPSTTPMSASVSGGSSSGIGVQMSDNILKGLYTQLTSRWLPKTAYGFCQAGEGLIHQIREPLSVVQEDPTSGSSFANRVFRFRVHKREEVDWLEPRFFVLMNDGSAK